MLSAFTRAVDRLVDLSTVIGGLALAFVTCVILVDVTGRTFGSPLTGAQDISEMAMVIVVFGGMALCDRLGGHVAVDIFANRFPPAMNRWLDIVSLLLGAAIFAVIAWTVWDSSKISQMLNLATNIIALPKAWFQWALAGFAALTALSMLLRALRHLLAPEMAAEQHKEEVL